METAMQHADAQKTYGVILQDAWQAVAEQFAQMEQAKHATQQMAILEFKHAIQIVATGIPAQQL